jgi:Ca2+-binding EF-hand superfamily protein
MNHVKIEENFNKYSKLNNYKGVVNQDIHKILKELKVNINQNDLNNILKANDLINIDFINQYNFEKIYITSKLLDMFRKIDDDNSGYINHDEIQQAMKQLGYKLKKKQCEQMLKKIDINGDNQISFEEFLIFFEKFPSIEYENLFEAWVNSTFPTDCGNDSSPTIPSPGLLWWYVYLSIIILANYIY